MSETPIEKNQSSIYLVKVQINSVRLHVRFPCALFFSLISDDECASDHHKYQLTNGRAHPKTILKIQTTITNSNIKHQDKKVHINVGLITKRGKILAGRVPIKLSFDKIDQPVKMKSKIQKCMDNQADIQYLLTVQLVEKIHKKQKKEFNLSYTKSTQNLFEKKTKVSRYLSPNYQNLLKPSNSFILNRSNSKQSLGSSYAKSRQSAETFKHESNLLFENLKFEKNRNFDLKKRQRQLMNEKKALEQELMYKNNNSFLKTSKLSESFVCPEGQISQYKEEIRDLKRKLADQETKFMESKLTESNEYNKVVQSLRIAERQNNQTLKNYNKKLSEFEEISLNRNQLLKEKEKIIQEQKANFKEIATKISEKDQIIFELQKKIKQLTQSKQMNSKQQEKTKQLQSQITELAKKLNQKEAEVKQYQEALKQIEQDYQRQIQYYVQTVNSLKQQNIKINSRAQELKEIALDANQDEGQSIQLLEKDKKIVELQSMMIFQEEREKQLELEINLLNKEIKLLMKESQIMVEGGLGELVHKLKKIIEDYFVAQKLYQRQESEELISKRKQIVNLKIKNQKYRQNIFYQSQCQMDDLINEKKRNQELNSDLKWMIKQNCRIQEEVKYIRDQLINIVGDPQYRLYLPTNPIMEEAKKQLLECLLEIQTKVNQIDQ